MVSTYYYDSAFRVTVDKVTELGPVIKAIETLGYEIERIHVPSYIQPDLESPRYRKYPEHVLQQLFDSLYLEDLDYKSGRLYAKNMLIGNGLYEDIPLPADLSDYEGTLTVMFDV